MPLSQAQLDALLVQGARPLGSQLLGQTRLIQTAASAVEGGTPAFDTEALFNNQDLTLLASAVQAATVTGQDRLNRNARGMILVFDQTAVPGVQTTTPKIQGKDPASGKYYDILVGAAQVGVVTIVLKVYPGITTAANLAVSDVLPRTWRFVVTNSGAGNFTYSVGGILLL